VDSTLNTATNTAANTTANIGVAGFHTMDNTASAAQTPVTNLPGVNFSSGAGASDSAVLNAQGKKHRARKRDADGVENLGKSINDGVC
jgi:hypothetical protein